MYHDTEQSPDHEIFDKAQFDIHDLQDEIRADRLCSQFLDLYYLDLVEVEELEAEDASAMAYGVSYFLREFVIPDRRVNIFEVTPRHVEQFAANWYVIKNLEPSLEGLKVILLGVQAFYAFCERAGKISAAAADAIRRACDNIEFYKQRIEDFWAMENDGYLNWDQKCSLKD